MAKKEEKLLDRKDIKERAKELIKGHLWDLWQPILVIFLISFVFGLVVGLLGVKQDTTTYDLLNSIFELATVPMSIGLITYELNFIRNKSFSVSDLFDTYKKNWVMMVLVTFVEGVLIALGLIALLIPGFILALCYSMTNYLLADGEEPTFDVLKKSREMMKGHKTDFLVFILSFLGWIFACLLVVPLVYFVPYASISTALYYEDLKKLNK